MKFQEYEKAVKEFVRRRNIAIETLTENQLVEVLLQAIDSEDFIRHVMFDERGNEKQAVTYVPYRERADFIAKIDSLEQRIKEYESVLFAASKYDVLKPKPPDMPVS